MNGLSFNINRLIILLSVLVSCSALSAGEDFSLEKCAQLYGPDFPSSIAVKRLCALQKERDALEDALLADVDAPRMLAVLKHQIAPGGVLDNEKLRRWENDPVFDVVRSTLSVPFSETKDVLAQKILGITRLRGFSVQDSMYHFPDKKEHEGPKVFGSLGEQTDVRRSQNSARRQKRSVRKRKRSRAYQLFTHGATFSGALLLLLAAKGLEYWKLTSALRASQEAYERARARLFFLGRRDKAFTEEAKEKYLQARDALARRKLYVRIAQGTQLFSLIFGGSSLATRLFF